MDRGRRPAEDPTAALLWAACRPEPDLDRCQEVIDAGADLNRAAAEAVVHRTSGLLWRVLEPYGDGAEWATELLRDTKRCRAQATLLVPRLADELFRPLAEADLTPLVFKGPALAARYPAPGLRPMDDVDIILPADRHAAAVKVMERAGWRIVPQPGEHHEIVLMHRGMPGLPVELHQELAIKSERPVRLMASDLWAARIPLSVTGAEAFGLPPELELVALAAHAAKPFHLFQRLIWSVDIAVLISSAVAEGHPLDWKRVESETTMAGARSALAVALTQAYRLGTDSPSHLRVPAATGVRRGELDPLMHNDWPVTTLTKQERYRLAYALIDEPSLRAQRALAEVLGEGALKAPVRATNLTWRATKRWWFLRNGRPGSSGAD